MGQGSDACRNHNSHVLDSRQVRAQVSIGFLEDRFEFAKKLSRLAVYASRRSPLYRNDEGIVIEDFECLVEGQGFEWQLAIP